MVNHLLRLMLCLALAANVVFVVPGLAFAQARMAHDGVAASVAQDHDQAAHPHQAGHHAATASHTGDECCAVVGVDQPSPTVPSCHCDMSVCTPVLTGAVYLEHGHWATRPVALLPAPDDAVSLSDLLPPLRPPRA